MRCYIMGSYRRYTATADISPNQTQVSADNTGYTLSLQRLPTPHSCYIWCLLYVKLVRTAADRASVALLFPRLLPLNTRLDGGMEIAGIGRA